MRNLDKRRDGMRAVFEYAEYAPKVCAGRHLLEHITETNTSLGRLPAAMRVASRLDDENRAITER